LQVLLFPNCAHRFDTRHQACERVGDSEIAGALVAENQSRVERSCADRHQRAIEFNGFPRADLVHTKTRNHATDVEEDNADTTQAEHLPR
jgi:hypothetical protein